MIKKFLYPKPFQSAAQLSGSRTRVFTQKVLLQIFTIGILSPKVVLQTFTMGVLSSKVVLQIFTASILSSKVGL